MKVDDIDFELKRLTLRPEDENERKLLDSWDKEGIKISHTGSTTGIISLDITKLVAVHLDTEQRILLAYVLGKHNQTWPTKVTSIISQLIPPYPETPQPMTSASIDRL